MHTVFDAGPRWAAADLGIDHAAAHHIAGKDGAQASADLVVGGGDAGGGNPWQSCHLTIEKGGDHLRGRGATGINHHLALHNLNSTCLVAA